MTEETAVTQSIADYYTAFSSLDVQAILPYFHQPALMIGPPGVRAVPDATALIAVFGPTMEGLKAREYRRSVFEFHRVKLMSETAAIAAGVAVRYKADGHELERVGITYVLHKSTAGWKIAVVVLDTDGLL
jgi:ketosteroid isomerase-like protein